MVTRTAAARLAHPFGAPPAAVDEQAERAPVEDCGIDAEAVEVVRRWVKRLAPRELPLVPRIFEPA